MTTYHTRTYIAGAWEEDSDAIAQLYKWKDSDYWSFDFVDAHDLTQARDTSLNCSIKLSLCKRMEHSKLFVLVVSSKTNSVRSGSCLYCKHYYNNRCYNNHDSVSFDSFIDYEWTKAVRENLKIIVLYNSVLIHKEWCPEILKNLGSHVAMKSSYNEWDYQAIKKAFDSQL